MKETGAPKHGSHEATLKLLIKFVFVKSEMKIYKFPLLNENALTYLLTYLLTYSLERVLEKLTGFQLVKTFLAFYGTRMFVTAFTSTSHLSLS